VYAAWRVYRLLADLILNKSMSLAIVVLTVVLGGAGVYLAGEVKQDDDVLAFLPQDNPDIETFHRINERFGGLDVALVGIATDDPFEADFLTRLQQVSKDVREAGGVERVLSITTVDDFTEDPMGGIITSVLVDHIPTNEAEKQALRDKVMSRDQIVGTMISENADAVMLYVFASPGTKARELADTTRAIVDMGFPDEEKYWGGAPFISTWIYRTTQEDMARLTPWAVVVIVFIILVSFRDFAGSMLALFTTSLGIVASRAAMAALDVTFNIVLSSMPVILFAVGSAYSIHMLSRYYANRGRDGDAEEALRTTIEETAPVVVAAGLTTMAGLGSFVMMDIAPMRTFGIFTALGIGTTLFLSVTFVPAVIRLYPLKGWEEGTGGFQQAMSQASAVARANRGITGALLLLLCGVGGIYLGQVDNRMDQSTFFSEGSPPDRAQTFMDKFFGGSQFLQIEITGDMSKPEVLREIRQLADEARLLPHVTSVNEISDVVATVNQAMDGVRRVPDNSAQSGVLYGFLAGRASVRQLVTDDRDKALMHIKIGSNQAEVLDTVLARVTALVDEKPTLYAVGRGSDEGVREKQAQQVSLRIRSLTRSYGVATELDDVAIGKALALDVPQVDDADLRPDLIDFLASEECFVELDRDMAALVADATLPLGAEPDSDLWADALVEALEPVAPEGEDLGMLADDIIVSAESVVFDLHQRAGATKRAKLVLAELGIAVPDGGKGERYIGRISAALLDLQAPTALLSATGEGEPLAWTVSGLPVMYNGLSQSVTRNQFNSLSMALGLVVVIMTVLFRSVWAGLLATVPTAITLVVVYGSMGAMGVHLDIGTSMLGSIIIGAGVDYAVHLMAAWRGSTVDEACAHAVLHTSPAIWTNACMVAAGFFILTLGDAKPLQNVGGLTSAAMLVAAVATFMAIPVLARKADYGERLT
jgi:hypothetical protein